MRIESGNGALQIDTDQGDQGFIVQDYSSNTTSVTYNPSKDIVLARPVTRSNVVKSCGLEGGIGSSASVTRTFRELTSGQPTIQMEVVVGRFAGEISPSTSQYGIRLYNKNNELAFDSGLYLGNGGFNVTEFLPIFSASGTGTNPISQDVDSFVSFNQTSINAFGSPQIYFLYDDDGANSNDGIRFVSFVPGPFGTTLYLTNFQSIFIGERGAGS